MKNLVCQSLALVVLAFLASTKGLRGQDDVVVVSTTDGSSAVPRLSITTSTATAHAVVRLDSAVLRLATTNSAGTNLAAGDIGYDGGIIRYYDGSSWKTVADTSAPIILALGPSSAQTYGGSNSIIHLNETGASSPDLLVLERGGSRKFVVENDGDIFTDDWLGSATNTFLGVNAADTGALSHTSGTEGWNNVAFGYYAGRIITTGSENTYFGYYSGYNSSSGSGNTAFGYNSGSSITTGGFNTQIGRSSGGPNSGSYNLSIGANTGDVRTGSHNVGLGRYAFYRGGDRSENVVCGRLTAFNWTSGDGNVFLGSQLAYYVTTGSDSIYIGYRSAYGSANHVKHRNIFLGHDSGFNETGSDLLYIEVSNSSSPLIWGNFSDDRVAINGCLGIKTRGFGTAAENSLSLINATPPSSSPANLVQLYSEDVTTAELKVRDEAGNVTTLSPHNFSILGGPSEEMAWSYYSRREDREIGADMLRFTRLVEELSGEDLVRLARSGSPEIPAERNEGRVPRLERIVGEQGRIIGELEARIRRIQEERR